jgi:predicted DNA-binding transcriptional regulator YafY
MPRGDQLARQWKIIQTLITSRQGKSAADLASEIECHPRTLYRDLEALQAAGFPVYTEKVEGKNLWSLLDTLKHHIPIPFSLTELMALYFGTDMLKAFKGTVFHDSLESLSKKIKATLPPESMKYLKSVEQTLQVGIKPYRDYARFREIINRVNEAALQKKSIEMVYYTMSRKKEGKRKVDPYRIWFFNGTFYLIGYCHLRREIRIFAVDRIKMLQQTKEPFEIPEEFDFEDFMRPSFGVFQGETVKVKIWFAPDAAGYIKEKIWHDTQEIVPQKDGSIVFEAAVAGTDEIRFWVMSWGSKALALEPNSLREEIRAELDVLLGKYEEALLNKQKPSVV